MRDLPEGLWLQVRFPKDALTRLQEVTDLNSLLLKRPFFFHGHLFKFHDHRLATSLLPSGYGSL